MCAGDENNMHPVIWGAQRVKIQNFFESKIDIRAFALSPGFATKHTRVATKRSIEFSDNINIWAPSLWIPTIFVNLPLILPT